MIGMKKGDEPSRWMKGVTRRSTVKGGGCEASGATEKGDWNSHSIEWLCQKQENQISRVTMSIKKKRHPINGKGRKLLRQES